MSGIGNLIVHDRYGLGVVTHVWKKVINPVTKATRLEGLTFKLLTEEGIKLFQRDRCLFTTEEPLPRCYERNLNKLSLPDDAS